MGCNWNNLDEAKAMIDKCAEHGFKFAKFQLFQDEGQGLPEHLYLTEGQAQMLFDYGKALNVEVFFTCMFEDAVDWCERIDVGRYKIRYMDRNNKELCKKIIETNKPYFISRLGFNDLTEFVRKQGDLSIFIKKDSEKAKILWCEPFYPSPKLYYPNPNCYGFIENFSGYSDHTRNLEMLKEYKKIYNTNEFYWEKHMKLDSINRLENDWSVTFEELADAISNERPEKLK